MNVTEEKTSGSRRTVGHSAPLGKSEDLKVQYGSSIRIRIVRDVGKPVVLVLRGELDITSMAPFEQALCTVMIGPIRGLVFDLRGCRFVSAQAYAAMGRCSLRTPVEVRTGTNIAAKVFDAYGYDRVTTVTPQGSSSSV